MFHISSCFNSNTTSSSQAKERPTSVSSCKYKDDHARCGMWLLIPVRQWLQLRFNFCSTALRPFDDQRYDEAAALQTI